MLNEILFSFSEGLTVGNRSCIFRPWSFKMMKPKKRHAEDNGRSKRVRAGFFTKSEVRLLRDQIRNNVSAIDRLIHTIDLLVNKECCPADANTLVGLRERLEIAIAENDTFRKALWRHLKAVEEGSVDGDPQLDPVFFLVSRIRRRHAAMMC